jgi:hypothetical protein
MAKDADRHQGGQQPQQKPGHGGQAREGRSSKNLDQQQRQTERGRGGGGSQNMGREENDE